MPGIPNLGGHVVFAYNLFLATYSQLKPRLQNTPSRFTKEHLSQWRQSFYYLLFHDVLQQADSILMKGASKVSEQEQG